MKSEVFGDTAPNQDPDGDSATFALDLRFPGQKFNAASGLNDNYFRNYEVATGRYVQSDPIGLNGGTSTYAYVSGNPAGSVDPLSLAPGDCYNNIDGAAADAVNDANQLLRKSGFEYGGRLYKRSKGGYSYTAPQTNGLQLQVDVGPFQPNTVGGYHSHGPYYIDPASGRPMNRELFTEPGDYDTAIGDAARAASHGNPYFHILEHQPVSSNVSIRPVRTSETSPILQPAIVADAKTNRTTKMKSPLTLCALLLIVASSPAQASEPTSACHQGQSDIAEALDVAFKSFSSTIARSEPDPSNKLKTFLRNADNYQIMIVVEKGNFVLTFSPYHYDGSIKDAGEIHGQEMHA